VKLLTNLVTRSNSWRYTCSTRPAPYFRLAFPGTMRLVSVCHLFLWSSTELPDGLVVVVATEPMGMTV
jgi:hypothetical protein